MITKKIIGCAINIHKALGPGLLESAYRECLLHDLKSIGYAVEKEKPMPVVYNGVRLDHGYRMDLLVEEAVVVEIKTVDELARVHFDQLLTYLKLGNYRVGLLINFHVPVLIDGVKRVANQFQDK